LSIPDEVSGGFDRSLRRKVDQFTTDLDPCLVAYPLEEWRLNRREGQKSSDDAERGERFYEIFSTRGRLFADWIAKGRVLIPPSLREYAKLNRDVTLIGIVTTRSRSGTAKNGKSRNSKSQEF